jgi:hypothetical protein
VAQDYFFPLNPQISQNTPVPSAGATGQARIILIIMKDDAKSLGFNSPQLAAIKKITLILIPRGLPQVVARSLAVAFWQLIIRKFKPRSGILHSPVYTYSQKGFIIESNVGCRK